MAQWVQHKSGIGEKWEVVEEWHDNFWRCHNRSGMNEFRLPKSEYVPCDPPTPPKRWVDVTAACELITSGQKGGPIEGEFVSHNGKRLAKLVCGGCYRLRKVQLYTSPDGRTIDGEQWAFLVEKEQP